MDVGAWSGFFSIEAERRGADRVLSTDSYAWKALGGKPAFDFMKRTLSNRIEERTIDVMDLSAEKIGTFDVVLFLGVLYHMRHPLLALEKVSSVCGDHLIVETHLDCQDLDYPAAAFYPGDELANDPTNWWGFNRAAVVGLLKTVGFDRVEYLPYPVKAWTASRGIFHAFRNAPTTLQPYAGP